jgi:hypothetical protein
MLQRLDGDARGQLRAFAVQISVLAAIALPVLLIDGHAPRLYLLQLRTLFGLSGFIALVLGALSRQTVPPDRFCVWDHCLAFLLLKSACGAALWALA